MIGQDGEAPTQETMAEARARLAARMAALRDEAEMSQREAARRAGMDQKNWSRIEAKEVSPRLESLLRIQFALRVDSIEELFGSAPTRQLLDSSRE